MKPLYSPYLNQTIYGPIDYVRTERDSARTERDSARTERDSLKSDVIFLEQQNVDRDLFVSTLTHDLKNPIGTVLMALEILKSSSNEKQLIQMAGIIERNAHVAQELIALLLDVNLIKSGGVLPLNKTQCNLAPILKKLIEFQSPQDEKCIAFEHQNNTEIWGYWDAPALARVFSNLLSNALKFRDRNSKVTVKAWQGKDYTSVSFQNFGKVISLKNQIRIFDKYFRGKSRNSSTTEGWGLGLTLVKGITESHSGKVSVESDSTNGTTFTIKLPNVHSNYQTNQKL